MTGHSSKPAVIRLLLFVALPCLITLGLYYPIINFQPVWDDAIWIQEIRAHPHFTFFDWLHYALTTPSVQSNAFYRPLAALTLHISFSDSFNPSEQWHIVSLILALLNIALTGLICTRLLPAEKIPQMFFIALILLATACHPMLVEVYAWASARFEQLYIFFSLLCVYTTLFCSKRGLQAAITAGCFLLALGCKETAIVLFAVLPLLQSLRAGKLSLAATMQTITTNRLLYCSLLLVFIAYLLARHAVLQGLFSLEAHQLLYQSPFEHGFIILESLGRYLRMLAYPFIELSPINARSGNTSLYTLSGAAFTLLLALSYFSRFRKLFFAGMIFLAAISPALNVVQLATFNDIVQNRYLGLSLYLLPVVLLCASNLQIGDKLRGQMSAVLVLSIILFGATSASIIPLWHDSFSLWTWTARENPASVMAQSNYAALLIEKGSLEEATRILEAANRIQPTCYAYLLLGVSANIRRDENMEWLAYRQAVAQRCEEGQMRKIAPRLLQLAWSRQEYLFIYNLLNVYEQITPQTDEQSKTIQQYRTLLEQTSRQNEKP